MSSSVRRYTTGDLWIAEKITGERHPTLFVDAKDYDALLSEYEKCIGGRESLYDELEETESMLAEQDADR